MAEREANEQATQIVCRLRQQSCVVDPHEQVTQVMCHISSFAEHDSEGSDYKVLACAMPSLGQ